MTALTNSLEHYFKLNQKDLNAVALCFTQENLSKGDYFVKAGHYCDKLSIVKSGYLRIYGEINTHQITRGIATAEHFITDFSSLVFDEPSNWNIQALSYCEIYTISKVEYKNLATKITNWNEHEKMFYAQFYLQMERRVYNLFAMTAQQRYDYLFEHHKDLFNHVPLQYLASMLDVSPETFSRIRKRK